MAESKVPLPARARGDSRSVASLLTPLLEGATGAPLYKQIYTRLREAVLNRSLSQARRLPSTRSLAANLGISRNTVLTAFEQLLAEGYFETRKGSGTYVAHMLPEDMLHRGQPVSSRPAAKLQP
ncbi:MAG TPA: winged helix-turn-helix domain-containing protein, partial [Terriglobia bacterium]|nr:winged helix-turn-helix domain-containing protein [Terriglobia bacterium]